MADSIFPLRRSALYMVAYSGNGSAIVSLHFPKCFLKLVLVDKQGSCLDVGAWLAERVRAVKRDLVSRGKSVKGMKA